MVATDKMLRAVSGRKFLANGQVRDTNPTRLANDLSQYIRQQAQQSPLRSEKSARKFVLQATPHGGILLSTALRTHGWTLHVNGRYAEARDAYLAARQMLKHDPEWRAKVDLILIDVFMYLSQTRQSYSRFKSALRTFERLGNKIEVAILIAAAFNSEMHLPV